MSDRGNGVLVERRGRALWITLDRPRARNALDWDAWEALESAWNELIDDPDLWVGVITATGDKAFSAGADLKLIPDQMARRRERGEEVTRPPVAFNKRRCDKPVIAAINGDAIGGGLEIALAADIRIAADHSRFGLPEARWGAIPGAGGTQRLPRLVPVSKALEMMFTGQMVTAQEALEMGLVSNIVPGAALVERTDEVVQRILGMAPLAVRAIKRAVMEGLETTLDGGLGVEAREVETVMASNDYVNNIKAFATGIAPTWTGR